MTTEFTGDLAGIVHELRLHANSSDEVLAAMTKAAVDAVDGADEASVTVVTAGRIVTPVAVGEMALHSDNLQRELGEGPCVRSAVDDTTIYIADLTTEERWPQFTAAATSAGIGSMVCCNLYIDGADFAALNLHSRRPHAFDEQARSLAELFAAHSSTTFAAVREKEQLRRALTSRDLIGQAKGMIMERYKIDADAAFFLLARLSQETNTKLVDVAADVVSAGPGA